MILHFNLVPEAVRDAYPVELSGNLRINLAFKTSVTENYMILLFANTTGIIQIDSFRQVKSLVRA